MLFSSCGSLAARAECSLCAAIRVRIVGRACGMFSACCNTRADRWLRVRGVLRVPQYVCGSLAARAGCSPHDAIRVWVNIYCFAVPPNPGCKRQKNIAFFKSESATQCPALSNSLKKGYNYSIFKRKSKRSRNTLEKAMIPLKRQSIHCKRQWFH